MRVENLGLTLGQVHVLCEAAQKPGTPYRPGDTINWTCSKCTFKTIDTAVEHGFMDTWPDELVEHIWRAGHYDIDTGRPPVPAYRDSCWERKALIVLAGIMVGFTLSFLVTRMLS
jgi:hypothetical protein